MNIFQLLACGLIGILGNSNANDAKSPFEHATKTPPNIVLVMADDQGWGDMAYYGHPHLKTPNFDESARTGLKFNSFYAAAPVCSPTRASVLTGRHPNRLGVFKWGYPIRPQEVTIAEVLKQHGYATAHFGKWHLGSLRHDSLATPGQNGFDHWISAPNFYDNNPVLSDNGKAVEYQGESSVIAADLAIDWMTEQTRQNKPFFAVVWFGSPHSPHQALEQDSAPYEALFANEKNQKLRRNRINFLGEVAGMDRAYGKIRQSLRDLEIENDTVLWYTSDNGALPQVGSSGPFRGHKGQVYDGGLRVPAILHWPSRFDSPMETDMRCSTCDIFPTLLDFAGIHYESDRPLDGTSLNGLTLGQEMIRESGMGFWDYKSNGRGVPADKLMRELMVAQANGQQLSAPDDDSHADRLPVDLLGLDSFPGHAAWIKGDWKLHRIENGKEINFELYDLKNDPAEKSDLAGEKMTLVKELQAELGRWLESVAKSYNGDDYRQ